MTAALAEIHRLDQNRIAARTLTRVNALWPLLDPADLDRTAERWLLAMLLLIDQGREASAERAARYYADARSAARPRSRFRPLPVLDEFAPAASTSLVVCGPVTIKRHTSQGEPIEQATRVGLARTLRCTQRHILAAGRDTIARNGANDPAPTAYHWQLSPNACNYCRGIGSRLASYDWSEGDQPQFRPHDGCGCGPRIIFT